MTTEHTTTPYTSAAPQRQELRRTVVSEDADMNATPTREIYSEQIAGPEGERVVRSEHVRVPSAASVETARIARIKQIVYFVVGVINVMLLMRFVFLALGASEASGFIRLIYGLSQPFVMPFLGIFGEPSLGASVFEWASLIAIAIYMLLAYGISRIIELMYAPRVTR